MSQLSAQAIKERCVYGMPMITPFVDKKVVVNGKSYGLSAASYDVRIASDLVLGPSPTFYMRDMLLAGGGKEMLDKLSNLPPPYALANTVEDFFMPKDVAAYVVDKSSVRQGVRVRVQHADRPRLSRQPDLGAGQHGARDCRDEGRRPDLPDRVSFPRPADRPPLRRQVPAPDERAAPRALRSAVLVVKLIARTPGRCYCLRAVPLGHATGGCHGRRRKDEQPPAARRYARPVGQERQEPEQDVAAGVRPLVRQPGADGADRRHPGAPDRRDREVQDRWRPSSLRRRPVSRVRDRPCDGDHRPEFRRGHGDLPARQDEHHPGLSSTPSRSTSSTRACRTSIPTRSCRTPSASPRRRSSSG